VHVYDVWRTSGIVEAGVPLPDVGRCERRAVGLYLDWPLERGRSQADVSEEEGEGCPATGKLDNNPTRGSRRWTQTRRRREESANGTCGGQRNQREPRPVWVSHLCSARWATTDALRRRLGRRRLTLCTGCELWGKSRWGWTYYRSARWQEAIAVDSDDTVWCVGRVKAEATRVIVGLKTRGGGQWTRGFVVERQRGTR